MAASRIRYTPEMVRNVHSLIRSKVFCTPVVKITELLPLTSSNNESPLSKDLHCRIPEKNCDFDIYVKCENKQKSGSFKFRGALNALLQRTEQELERGIVSYSTGNHGKALAFASRLVSGQRGCRIPISIVMSKYAAPAKILAVRNAGAEVLLFGETIKESRMEAERIAKDRGVDIIPPAGDEDVTLGQGTVMLEFMEQVREMSGEPLDAVILPSGGGGLLAGSAIAGQGTSIEVFGSEPLDGGANCARSLLTEMTSTILQLHIIADCLRTLVSPLNWEIIKQQKYVRNIFWVSDDEIRQAMALLIDHIKILIEPGSAVPLAASLFHPGFCSKAKDSARRQKVGIVPTGGNTTLEEASHVIKGLN